MTEPEVSPKATPELGATPEATPEAEPTPTPKPTVALDAEAKRQLSNATERLDTAERELTLAMEALAVPALGADNEMVGERLRAALSELGRARQALTIVLTAAL